MKALYASTGSIFQPFCNFSQTALVAPSLKQVPQIKEVSIKDRPFFCTAMSPGFTLITYSIEDGLKVRMWVLVHHGLSLLGFFMGDLYTKLTKKLYANNIGSRVFFFPIFFSILLMHLLKEYLGNSWQIMKKRTMKLLQILLVNL